MFSGGGATIPGTGDGAEDKAAGAAKSSHGGDSFCGAAYAARV